ncbi:reverse transcriptase domain-containing protein [Tanacetum coccineum]
MIKYLAGAKECIVGIKNFAIWNICRNLNQKADILSKLALVAFNYLMKEVLVKVLSEPLMDRKEINVVVEEEEDNWMTPIIRCLEEGVWSEDKNEARALRMKINQYVLEGGVLFKKYYLVPMLRCVGPLQATMSSWKYIWEPAECILAPDRRFGLSRVIVTDNETQFVNKSLMEGIKTRLGMDRAGWVNELPNVLWAHQTSLKQSNRETPFSLTYESEAMKNEASMVKDQGKLGPKWEGPYRVTKAYQNGSYKLQTMEDKGVPRTCKSLGVSPSAIGKETKIQTKGDSYSGLPKVPPPTGRKSAAYKV